MAAEMWRVPVSVVKLGRGGSVIEDRGVLRRALTASNGKYLFSEVGAGVQSLALVGLWHEVLNFLAKRPSCGIDNRIRDLPEIYMGMCYYRPGQRFVGLFPVQEAVSAVVGQVVGIAGAGLGNVLPGATSLAGEITSSVTEVIGGVKDGRDVYSDSRKGVIKTKSRSKPDKNMSLAANAVYIKFSYLQEKDMVKIGSKSISFETLHPIVLKTLSARA
ncbi:MAG TPA: hypothetical protein PKE27_08565 [Povalibacter sp.]|uniref:hypothetical protein n=1 Tax=Povalibacter sp. TaxID=1962978 RepID=UPI002B6E4905|nr:hypothetical protein [Povalibacter sp.]HMN44610.1 hypothetical protein [Povalibacter sp.]